MRRLALVRNLVKDGVAVTAFDLGSDPYRMKLIMSADEVESVNFVSGDITDLSVLEASGQDNGVTDIIHLAALSPGVQGESVVGPRKCCRNGQRLRSGAQVGPLNARSHATSVAAYGLREGARALTTRRPGTVKPRTLYGVYKQANEVTARIYARTMA